MTLSPRPTVQELSGLRIAGGQSGKVVRLAPQETAVALVHDGGTTAVMMATPSDIEDLAIGFALNEGIIASLADVTRLEIMPVRAGIEARLWLAADRSRQLAARRRRLAGPTGCGLCGIESLQEAVRALPFVSPGLRLSARDIHVALQAMTQAQSLGAATRATHAAAWWSPSFGLGIIREDVGRHNALDKLGGALARSAQEGAREPGAVILTSRVSIEMVQKAVMIGAQAVVAVSAPTALAVRQATACGLTLIGIARDDGFIVFSHPQRVVEVEATAAAALGRTSTGVLP